MALAQFRQGGIQTGLSRGDHGLEPLHGGGVRLQSLPALGRLPTFVGMPGQPALDLLQTLGQDASSLDQAGGPHVPLAPAQGGPGYPLIDPTPILTGGARTLAGPGHDRLQPGELLAQLHRPRRVPSDPVVELGVLTADLLQVSH